MQNGAETILIVDDDKHARKLMRTWLESADYVVAEAGDGNEALKYYRSSPAALVICDIFMPDKDGLELMQELRKEYPSVKIIAVSGSLGVPSDSMLAIARILGALRTIPKPIDFKSLLSIIKELLAIPV